MFYPITYNEPLFRPPAEAYSLIFQVTLGCSWNKCAFCEMYTSKKFKVRPFKDVKAEINKMASQSSVVRKFFLADGNAMILSYKKLIEIINEINNSFSSIQRISAYALPNDILLKSPEELKNLRNAGLKLLYVGIESGDNQLLKIINKRETFDSTTEGLIKAHEAGIDTSVMIINGLGGKKYSKQHAIESAKIVNKTQSKFLSFLALSLPFGTEHYQNRFADNYIPMSQIELLEELKIFISNTDLKKTIFRSDHISNYLILKGNLPESKERFINEIDQAIEELKQDPNSNSNSNTRFKGL